MKPAPSAASAPAPEEDEFLSAESSEEEEEGAAEGAAAEGQKGWSSSFWGKAQGMTYLEVQVCARRV